MKRGDVNQSEHRARYELGGRGGGSIQGDDTERGGVSALARLCRKTLLIFFFSSPPPQDCLALAYGVSILLSDRCEEGVEEEKEEEEGEGEESD